ncbi:MAG: Fic family protein [Phycisphaerales bacterium]
MTFVHEREDWPRFRWDDKVLAPLLARVRHAQGRLLGKMESLGLAMRDETSLSVLTRDVVKSSAIEGEKLDADEVRSSLARRLGLDVAGLKPSGRDVDGIVEMMLDATQKYELALTAERLYGWHAELFPAGWSGTSRIAVGKWRPKEAGAMQVVSGPIGRERVHFVAPEAERLDEEMQRFLTWFNGGDPIDPVLRAGVAHFWFVTVHPFEDGNGRIARAIADMCLARADRSKQRFYSMSAQIEAERKEYFLRLETQQRSDVDITPWLEWFLACLERAIGAAEEAFASVLRRTRLWQALNHGSLNERQKAVINRMIEGFEGNLTTSKYAKLSKCSADSALRDIRELVEQGILAQNTAGGRSTSYRLAETAEPRDVGE